MQLKMKCQLYVGSLWYAITVFFALKSEMLFHLNALNGVCKVFLDKFKKGVLIRTPFEFSCEVFTYFNTIFK